MSPLCSQPAVIVVKPPDHGANIESAVDWVENVRRAGYSCTVWNDSTFNYRPEQLRAFFEAEGFEAAADGVEKDVASGLVLYVYEINGVNSRTIHDITNSEV
jgi:hypothetical protein